MSTLDRDNEHSNNVTPIDIATNTVGANIALPTGASGPTAIAITPDQAPVAGCRSPPPTPEAPTRFDASASTVAYGTIASYAWNFGDGSTTATTSPTTTNTYAVPGTFTASVTETSSGGTSTAQVVTGQTVSRNGGSSAVDSRPVTVPATVPPGEGVATSPQFGVPNQTDVFDVNNNGAVEVRWIHQGVGNWNGPLVISPPGLAPPGAHLVASNQFGLGNQTDVFVVGTDGATRVLWIQGAGAWQGPLAITAPSTAPAGAALVASAQFGIGNQTDVFVVGNDGATRVSWVDGAGPWNGPSLITFAGNAPHGALLVASNQFGIPNQTDVFLVANSGAPQVVWVDGNGAWHGPLQI